MREQRVGGLNDNERFTDPFESGEWLGEEALTVSVKLQPDGSRQTGVEGRVMGRGQRLFTSSVREPVTRSTASADDYGDGIKLTAYSMRLSGELFQLLFM